MDKRQSSSPERRNYYRILNVQPDASLEIIRSSFRTLMQKLKLHPDLGGNAQEAAIINEAYQVLSNTEQRARYDEELLAEFGINQLSQGHLHQAESNYASPSADTDDHGNQRNYYRILNVQPDAPDEIIRRIYLSLKKDADSATMRLLSEAYSIIGNEDKRKLYDQLLSRYEHVQAVEFLFESLREKTNTFKQTIPPAVKRTVQHKVNASYNTPGATPYRPVITQYCQFCKTPHQQSPCEDTAPLCIECKSPLFPPSASFLKQNRRDIVRIAQRHGACSAWLTWPGKKLKATIGDMSPTGMQIQTDAKIDENHVIKLDGDDFKAVGMVTYCSREFEGEQYVKHVCGIKFLTVNFNRLKGQFFSANA